MPQETLFSAPVTVFEVEDGTTTERGNGACSIVGQAGSPPRYKLVCFDDQRNVLCTATIGESNEHSLRFQLQSIEYATFNDDQDGHFAVLFLRSGDVEVFLAHLATAFYGACRQPTHSTVIADFAHTSKRGGGPGSEVLDLGRRAKTRFQAFDVTCGETSNDLPLLASNNMVDESGDMPYAFEAVQSAFSLPEDGKGFESSVVGMITDTYRAVVVPATLPRNSTPATATRVFVVHLKRVVADPAGDVSGALVEAKNTARANAEITRTANALVTSGRRGDDDGPPRPRHNEGSKPGSGVPAEHMLLVRKVASQVNTALSGIRDLQDKIEHFNSDWKQSVTRPKPSILPNNALEQNLRNLINDNERAKEELERREDLMRALEERNRDLQKRVDKAAQLAQTLMEEKKKTVSQTSDMRLEMDRQNLRLTEQITQAMNERDDVQRHLETVKKLLNMSDDALKDMKGKFDIVQVQVRGTGDKLDAAEDQLGEERTRRKALEAKVGAQQEELRTGMVEVKTKSAELDDVTRKADADRIYQAQLMEDERERRSIEVAQLRSEIITELQNRDEKFTNDRQRVSSESFDRGREEGMELGRRNARIDIEHRMQELQLEAQRTKTELDAYKTQLRDARDDAMAENRRLEAAVAGLKTNVEESTKSKARNEYLVHSLRLRVKHAEDALMLGLTTNAHRLSRTAEPTDVHELLDQLHKGDPRPDLGFEDTRHAAEAAEAYARRERWMLSEAVDTYTVAMQKTFDEAIQPMADAFADMNADVARLWYERDMRDLEDVLAGEASLRSHNTSEEEVAFKLIEEQLEEELAAQKAIIDDEAKARPAIVAEYDDFAADLAAFIVEQACARQGVSIEEEANSAAIMSEEDEAYVEMREAFERVIFEKVIAEQGEVMGDEDQARIAIADDESGEADALRKQAAEEASDIRDMLAEREKQMRADRSELEGEEARGRVELEMDEDSERSPIHDEFTHSMPKPPTPPPPTPTPPRTPTPEPVREPTPPAAVPAATHSGSDSDQPDTAPPSKSVPPPMPPAARPRADSDNTSTASGPRAPPPMPPKGAPKLTHDMPMMRVADDSESDVGSAPAMPMPRPKAKHVIPADKAVSNPLGADFGGGTAAAAADSGSDSDGGGGFLSRPAPKPAAKRPAAKPASTAALFGGSGSDDDESSVPTIRPKPPAKKSVVAPAAMFGSDSDAETPRAPAPAKKPSKKPAAKRSAVLFDSESE